MLAILCQFIIWLAAAAEMSGRLLHTVVFTSPVADGTRMDSEAGATIHMQARARMAFTVVGAPGVNASVLAASIMDLAFINICRHVTQVVAMVSMETVWPIANPSVVTLWIVCTRCLRCLNKNQEENQPS